ncbi:hypothetical protein [Phaeocystidibacter marisrubri]|uniref:Uncharacterized protein n=1 Tax=Phaeocystidibacter marisrubri TaxID=1577780 RepID=A0A6L3ZKK5_9FLAO|nr:hypothetical protein [Phaeocystidibacter marisrubri]KAB2817995.1 hypothetical protein F8C82_06215 [Phaeocystidibacter marisrubri]GGH72490.1 hypothetical protein GCM10011318_16490 [Phaeocystidibacter marisrubri]
MCKSNLFTGLIFGSIISISAYAQIYVPNNQISGSSGKSNVGIGISSPSSKLQISINQSIGAVQLNTARVEGPSLGGSLYTQSPFALAVALKTKALNGGVSTS